MSSFAVVGQEPTGPISVCELLQRAEELNEKIVRVQGLLQDPAPSSSDPNLDELVGDDCVEEGQREAKIQVVMPDQHFLANPPRGYAFDITSAGKAQAAIADIVTETGLAEVSVEVDGYFLYVGDPSDASETSAPPRHRRYLGHLVLQAYRDLKAVQEGSKQQDE